MKLNIQETTNYGKFKTIRGNRPLNRKYLTRLAESIRENNMLPENPIMVNSEMKVIDGQHRLKVAEILNIPIYYIVLQTGSLREVQQLNTNVRGWTTKNFLDSYIAIGREDYEYLSEFSEKNDISLSNSMMILTGGYQASKKGKLFEQFKIGDFKVTQKEYAENFAKKINELARYLENGVKNDRDFVKALERVYRSVRQEKLITKFKLSGTIISKHGTEKDYIREFEDVLSWKSKTILRLGRAVRNHEEQVL